RARRGRWTAAAASASVARLPRRPLSSDSPRRCPSRRGARSLRGPAAALVVVVTALAAGAAPGGAALISQGAFRIGADALWSQGVTGAGQTVAILDMGFTNLDAAIAAGELPPREAMPSRSFDAAYGLDGRSALGGTSEHGVRMAELVHDIAPDATLVLVNYHTEPEFEEAAAWVAANGIPIVNHSNSFLSGPFDGSGPAARAVDAAAAAGVLWVNSVGNYAERHWAGVADPAGTVVPIAPRSGDTLEFALGWAPAPDVRASVAVERADAAGAWSEVAGSALDPGAPGAETAAVPVDGAPWRLVVRQQAGPAVPLSLFSRTVGFGAMAVPDGSVPTPGDARGALSVGAVRWDQDQLAPYSSHGPTADGRSKPDLVAPTYVTSNPAWPSTGGSSAAAAHVAAAAALLRQQRAAQGLPIDAGSLRAALLASAADLGQPGPDGLFGAGMLRLDTTAPTIRVRVGAGRRPLARISAADAGTLGRLSAALDGRPLADGPGPRLAVRLPDLAGGRHLLTVTASDMARNVGSARLRLGPRR
ncbi:MAG: hypothetical protein QOK40_2160, partial [Miltoncostaeaceae bacterium]|nr:hypothetical protein [Miltoncostaeaceae bacterium]